MTWRAFVVGSILSTAIGLILPVTELVVRGTRLGLSSATPAAFFLLFLILIGPQLLLRCVKPEWAFKRGELIVVFAMMTVATVIPTRGFGGMFFGMTTGPTYYATAENQWEATIRPHLSSAVVVKDKEAVRQMYEELDEGRPFPWRSWIGPLGWWTGFMLLMATMIIAVMFMFRSAWIEHERLAFPVANVAMALIEEGPQGSRVNPLFRSAPFWIGFLIPLVLESLNGLHWYFPNIFGGFRPRWSVPRSIAWASGLRFRISFLMIGFAFFIESKVAFSLWFFYLLSVPAAWLYGLAFPGHGEALGVWSRKGAAGAILAHQQVGAMLILLATMVWRARHSLSREKRIGLLFLVSALLWGVMLWHSGVPAWIAPLVVASALLIWISMTRLMAQAGIATIVPAIVPFGLVVSTTGVSNLGAVGLVALGLTFIWAGDMLTFLMGPTANSVYLQHREPIRPATGVLTLLSAVMLSFAACMCMTLFLTYRVGALDLHPQYFTTFPRHPWRSVSAVFAAGAGPSVTGFVWTGIGAAIMLLLTYLHGTFFWWPLHPLGFLAQGGWVMRQLWFSLFLAWLVKVAVLKYGGGRAYRKSKDLFTGIVVGLLVTGGLWLIVNSIFGKTGGIGMY